MTDDFATAIGKIFHNNIPDPQSWSEPKHYVKGFPFDPDAVYLTKANLDWLETRKRQLKAAGKAKRRIDRFGMWYLKATAAEAPKSADSAYYDGAQTDVAVKKLAALKKRKQPFFGDNRDTHILDTARRCRSTAPKHTHLHVVLRSQPDVVAAWCELVRKFGQTFNRAAGSAGALQVEAHRRGQTWMQSPGNPLSV